MFYNFLNFLQAVLENTKATELNESLRNTFQLYRDLILKFKPKAKVPSVDECANINNSHISLSTNHHPLGNCFVLSLSLIRDSLRLICEHEFQPQPKVMCQLLRHSKLASDFLYT